MTFPTGYGSNLYSQNAGIHPENVEVPDIQTRAPTTSDVRVVGKRWIDLGVAEYVNLGNTSSPTGTSSVWTLISSAGGVLDTLTGDSGGAITPSASNITLAGTGSQITTTGSGSTITFSIPATFLAPGSIASTTTLTSGTSLAVTTSATVGTTLAVAGTSTIHALSATSGTFSTTLGVTGLTTLAALTQVGTASINGSGAAVTTIGTGGTGAVNIGNATGNTAVTGSLTASTTLTATLGAITATNGNLVLGTSGNKLVIPAVSNTATAVASAAGTVTLITGTITVTTTAVTASSIILLTRQSVGASTALGELTVGTVTAGVSFVITAATLATPGTPLATDASVVGWVIIN
jgi:hypothetical protein